MLNKRNYECIQFLHKCTWAVSIISTCTCDIPVDIHQSSTSLFLWKIDYSSLLPYQGAMGVGRITIFDNKVGVLELSSDKAEVFQICQVNMTNSENVHIYVLQKCDFWMNQHDQVIFPNLVKVPTLHLEELADPHLFYLQCFIWTHLKCIITCIQVSYIIH